MAKGVPRPGVPGTVTASKGTHMNRCCTIAEILLHAEAQLMNVDSQSLDTAQPWSGSTSSPQSAQQSEMQTLRTQHVPSSQCSVPASCMIATTACRALHDALKAAVHFICCCVLYEAWTPGCRVIPLQQSPLECCQPYAESRAREVGQPIAGAAKLCQKRGVGAPRGCRRVGDVLAGHPEAASAVQQLSACRRRAHVRIRLAKVLARC